MKIELKLLDMSKIRIHENEMIYKSFYRPIPNVGDRVLVEGLAYSVKERGFIYLSGGSWC